MTTEIRVAKNDELPRVAENFRQMWLDIGFDDDSLVPDWRARTEQFLDDAIRDREGRAFVATLEGRMVGSAVCQRFEGLYPSIVRSELRKSGYLWGVYVDHDVRRHGIASALTRASIDYLREIHCHRILLHASLEGQPVYEALGFAGTNERALELSVSAPVQVAS